MKFFLFCGGGEGVGGGVHAKKSVLQLAKMASCKLATVVVNNLRGILTGCKWPQKIKGITWEVVTYKKRTMGCLLS